MAFDTSVKTRDRDLEKNGTWMVYDDETRFLVARKNNSAYKAFISKAFRENERLLTTKTNFKQADEKADNFMLEGTARYLLLGWEGVTSKGIPVEYTPEKAMEVLEEHDDLRAMIEEFSESRENFIAGQDIKDSENLGKSSAGQ